MMNQSKATTERHQRALLELLKQPGNTICADCHARNPRWASWSLGIFLCVQCAGVHRKMGVHVSKVKSVTLDSWTKDQLDRMKSVGNVKSNAAYIPNETAHPPPTDLEESDRGSQLERFIRLKYERQAFIGTPSTTAAVAIRRPPSTASSPSTSTASVPSASPPPVPPKPVPALPSPSTATSPAFRMGPTMASTGAPAPSLPSHLGEYQPPRSASLPTPSSDVVTNPFYRSQGPPRPAPPAPSPPVPPPPQARTDGVWGDLLSLSDAPPLAFSSTAMSQAHSLPQSYPHQASYPTSPAHPFFAGAGQSPGPNVANPFVRPHAHSFSNPSPSPSPSPYPYPYPYPTAQHQHTNPFLAPDRQHHFAPPHQHLYPVQYHGGAHQQHQQQQQSYPYATM